MHAFSRTPAGQFFRGLMLLLFVIVLPVGSVAGFSAFAWHQFANESRYQKRFGDDWKMQFEANEGRLSTARVKVGVVLLGAIANSFLGVLLYRHLVRALRGGGSASRSSRRRSRRRRSSHAARQ